MLGGDVPNPINPPSGCRFHPRCPRAQETCVENDPPLAPQAPRHEAACFFPLEKWPLTDAEMRMRARGGDTPVATSVSAAIPIPPVDVRLRRSIARGLRDLALVALALAGFTGLASLAVGGAAGLSAQRAPSRAASCSSARSSSPQARSPGCATRRAASRRERLSGRGAASGRLTSWADAFQLSAALVGLGMGLVLLGVLLHPRASF